MNTQNALTHSCNGSKPRTTQSLLDLPEEILSLIGQRASMVSPKSWLNLAYTCRYLYQLYTGDPLCWKGLATPRLTLPYWLPERPRRDCVFQHYKDWKSAYMVIRKTPLPNLEAVYAFKQELVPDLDPSIKAAWTAIKLFPDGSCVESHLRSKSTFFPKNVFDGTITYGEWRVSVNLLVVKWFRRQAKDGVSARIHVVQFEIRDKGKELRQVGAYFLSKNVPWSYIIVSTHDCYPTPIYQAYTGLHVPVSQKVIAAMLIETPEEVPLIYRYFQS